MGDSWDSIFPRDRRYDSTIHARKLVQGLRDDDSTLTEDHYLYGKRFFEPIARKCIGFMKGNHEDVIEQTLFTNFTRKLCSELELPYLGYVGMTRLEIAILSGGKHPSGSPKHVIHVDIFSEHGGSGGGTDGNALNQHAKRMDDFEADLYLKGHVHKRWIIKRTLHSWGPTRPVTRTRVLVGTGTYLRGYEPGVNPYPEKKGLPPNEIGGCVVLIKPRYREGVGGHPAGVQIDAVYTEAAGMLSAA